MQLTKVFAFGVAFLGFAMAAPAAEPVAVAAPAPIAVAEPVAAPELEKRGGGHWRWKPTKNWGKNHSYYKHKKYRGHSKE
ncbi:hypothetical protein TWF718_010304 [Orbilia javanica]|uniref:Uncharacterized protein n=1 Tax=Orbilia javanica TaxID=47235 RepID=A0AAN8RAY8_9PEZI